MEIFCYNCGIPLTTSNQYLQCLKTNCYNRFCLNCISINSFSFCPHTLLYRFDCSFCYT